MTRLWVPKSSTITPSVAHRPIQRRCACGGGTGLSGVCEDCRKKRLVGERAAHGLGRIHHGGGFGGESDSPPQAAPENIAVPVDQPSASAAAAPALVCDPDRALTWADFTGAPPQGNYAAKTAYTFPKDTTVTPNKFRAVLDTGNSWVKPKWKNPTVRADTGAQASIDDCKAYLKANPNNLWSLDASPDAQCPASPIPDATIEAGKQEECDSKIGPEEDRVALLESNRLLAHEQLHFTIACVLVKKANASVVAGKSVSDIETKLSQTDTTVTTSYDTDSNHGCKAAEQTTWNTKVANGLPDIKIE